MSGLRTQKTRKGELMARAQLEDLSGSLGVVFFPKVYEQYSAVLREEQCLFISGRLQVDSERSELLAEEVLAASSTWSPAVPRRCSASACPTEPRRNSRCRTTRSARAGS